MAVARIGDVEIDYEREIRRDADQHGLGPILVWGHGLTSSRAAEAMPPVVIDWERARRHLDVIRYDARGHGRSGCTDEPESYRWARLAIDQLGLLDTIGLDRCVLGGASMGAATALHSVLAAAVESPERVAGLVLVIPPTAWETRAAQADLYRRAAELVEAGRLDQVLAASRLVPPPDPFVAMAGWHDRSAERLRAIAPEQLALLYRGAGQTDLPVAERVAAIEVPTLILAWTGDPSHPVETAHRLDELLPMSTLHVASTADEVTTWTDRVVDFVTGIDGIDEPGAPSA